MARWNRLEQPEQPGQAAIQTAPTPGRPEAFVRARGVPVLRSAACPQLKFTDRKFLMHLLQKRTGNTALRT